MRGDRVGAKIQDRATRARFWPKECAGIHFHAEGTIPEWGTPCFRSWGPAIGRGTRGGCLVPKHQKLSRRGSVLADKIWWASVLGRGDLGRAREVYLREGRGGSLAGMQSGD